MTMTELKCKTGSYWGTPVLLMCNDSTPRSEYISNEDSEGYEVLLVDKWFDFEIKPCGSQSSMGHGCGSGYSASKLVLSNGYSLTDDVTIRPKREGL